AGARGVQNGNCNSYSQTPCRPRPAVLERTEQNLISESIAHFLLDDARERAGAELRIVALRRQPGARLGQQRDRDVALGELSLELQDELLDDRFRRRGRQRV